MDSCASHKFSGHQFGFIPTRGTNMATALAHDICVYSSHIINNGEQNFDLEGQSHGANALKA